jgi:hypothetical protein
MDANRTFRNRAEGLYELVDGYWYVHTPHWGMIKVASENSIL